MNKENKKRYIALKEKVDRIKYPNVPYPVPPLTHERGANDLTKLIKNFLNWQGWQAERINTRPSKRRAKRISKAYRKCRRDILHCAHIRRIY